MKMWLLRCFSVLLIVHFVQGNVAPPTFFRKDYQFNDDTQNFYKVHTATRSWSEAKGRCQLEGATLFYPDSKEDHDAVVELMKTKLASFDWAWIGIHDLLSEGEFTTIDGISVDDVYHQWDQWEPNNAGDAEDCVILKKNGKNNDEDCQKKFPFVCKKSRASIEWNVLCDMPDQNFLYNRDLGKCYKLHLDAKNWNDAFSVCNAEQSYLAVINSKQESDHLKKMVADAPKNKITGPYLAGAVHLGFHNHFNEGFQTVQGVKLENSGYAVWGGGQPDNAGGGEKCGSMFYDGTLNDMGCGTVCIFVCEHDIGNQSSNLDERIKGNEP